ncbi:MAG: energy-coupling factor transporter ATPase [Anaerosomatales bacterium]|nr:energy-coupling factor transporter ATPase [Anaerosomatales bacterium]
MIEFIDVAFTYPGVAEPAVSDVSLLVRPGEVVAVVGPNGSGKSTIARLADGLLTPGHGRIMVDGMDTRDTEAIYHVRARVGLVLQNPDNQIVGTVVEEDVAFGPENLGVPLPELAERVAEAIELVGLAGLERREPHLLSEGQKQRLAIAGALALGPRYLVLDEPTAMLDPEGRTAVLAIIERLRAEGRGIVHVTHHLEHVVRADRVLALDRGRIVFAGVPEELLSDVGLLGRLGLEPPALVRLAEELGRHGFAVPRAVSTAEELAGALWRS